MRLHEEYFKRHSIDDVPVVHHRYAGSLILKTDPSVWSSRWVLILIRWENHDYHPGQYKIDISIPIHDSYEGGVEFFTKSTITKKWHEYEDFFFDWGESLKSAVPVVGTNEVILAAWEMFVFSYDSWFAKQSFEIKNYLFECLDEENSIDHQYQNYQNICMFLSIHHSQVLQSWKYEFLARIQNYSNWLALILDGAK